MTTDLHTLSMSSSIAAASKLFSSYKIHHIPVVEHGMLKGIISKSDYLFFKRGFRADTLDEKIEEIRLNNYTVSHIMTRGIATLASSDKINVALEIFRENLFHAIPIVDEGRLVGIVTTYDIIYHLANDKVAFAHYELSHA